MVLHCTSFCIATFFFVHSLQCSICHARLERTGKDKFCNLNCCAIFGPLKNQMPNASMLCFYWPLYYMYYAYKLFIIYKEIYRTVAWPHSMDSLISRYANQKRKDRTFYFVSWASEWVSMDSTDRVGSFIFIFKYTINRTCCLTISIDYMRSACS